MSQETIGKKITKKKIQRLNEIYAEIDVLAEKASDALKNAKQFKNEQCLVKRPEGTQMIKQGFLWEEVRMMGKGAGESYDALKALYPNVFELSEKQAEKKEELTVFCHTELGVDPVALRLRDIINLVDQMLEYKMEQMGLSGDKNSPPKSP